MKKIFLIITSLAAFGYNGFAQGPGFGGTVDDNGTASTTINNQNVTGMATQTVNLALSNALDISFASTNTNIGTTVVFPFSTVTNYAEGLQSADYQVKVRSNKMFTVTVKASAQYFTVNNGSGTTASSMPVASVLGLKVVSNQTGGALGGTYPSGQFGAVTNSALNLLVGCIQGNNQWFNVKYKATPGFDYPAGNYTTDVIYTATQQ